MEDQFYYSKPVKKVLKTRIAKKKKKPLETQKSFGKFEIILESPKSKDLEAPSYESLRKVIYDQRDMIEEKEKEKN